MVPSAIRWGVSTEKSGWGGGTGHGDGSHQVKITPEVLISLIQGSWKTDIKVDTKETVVDRDEPVGLMEPLLASDTARHRSGPGDLTVDLAVKFPRAVEAARRRAGHQTGCNISPSYTTTPPANRVAQCRSQLAQASEVRSGDGRSGLDPPTPATASAPALDDDIHLNLIPVAKVEELQREIVPAGLPPQFLEHEGFKKLTQ